MTKFTRSKRTAGRSVPPTTCVDASSVHLQQSVPSNPTKNDTDRCDAFCQTETVCELSYRTDSSLDGLNVQTVISELKDVIKRLCDRVDSLERTLKEDVKTVPVSSTVKVANGETQTDGPTYAQVAKQSTSVPNASPGFVIRQEVRQQATPKTNKQTRTETGNKDKEKQKAKKVIEEKKKTNDVKTFIRPNPDVNEQKNARAQQCKEPATEDKGGLPKVLLLHDSVLKGVKENRLGRSYFT